MISFLIGLISLQSFTKDDVLVEYHVKVVTNINADQYCLQPGVLSEYVLQIAGPPRRLIDASNEWNVCLGSLANHSTQKKNEVNMKMVEVVVSSIGERIVIIEARRDIAPFEQLRFDYGDKVAQAFFDDSSYMGFGYSTKSCTRFVPVNLSSVFESIYNL